MFNNFVKDSDFSQTVHIDQAKNDKEFEKLDYSRSKTNDFLHPFCLIAARRNSV